MNYGTSTRLAVLCFFVTGASHIIQPRVWVRFFMDLHAKGKVGSFLNALLHFPVGAFIVSFHNVWHGLPIVLTLIGWGLVLKSFIYVVFPKQANRMLGRVSIESLPQSQRNIRRGWATTLSEM